MRLLERPKSIFVVVAIVLAAALSCATVEGKSKQNKKENAKRGTILALKDASPSEGAAPVKEEEVESDDVASLQEMVLGEETNSDYLDADPLLLYSTPADYDSLIHQWYQENSSNAFDDFFKEYIELDSTLSYDSEIPDSVYTARLKKMLSPINLGYNDIVKRYIVVYTKRKTLMSRVLGLSKLYFPLIEQELANEGLPLELRMLPVIESALNPTAVSRMGATGLWQFMYRTGKSYGLEITSFIDERRDPIASTKAACRFLKDLYGMYGDWTLAIAAYNCGPGNVNKALRRAGEGAKTFWDIYNFLPRETRGYLPAFVASSYAYNYHKLHDIEPQEPNIPILTDTLHINQLMHFEQITSTIGTPIEIVRSLNPQYKLDIIPANEEKHYVLTVPQSDVTQLILRQKDIMAKDTVYLAQYLKQDTKTGEKEFQTTSVEYRIKSGDTLGAIARKYGVTVKQLMQWNNIKNAHALRIGQRLQIYR